MNSSLSRPFRALCCLLLGGVLVGCVQGQDTVGASTVSVVYGVDNRLEPYQVTGPLRRVADEAIVVMLHENFLDARDPNNITFRGQETLSQSHRLCAGERFADQVVGGSCSGTLIDDRHILTAGHCMGAEGACRNDFIWVFGFRVESSGALANIDSDDVYRCSQTVAHFNDGRIDYAVLELDRPVVGHTPAQVSRVVPRPGDPLTLIGHPSGLPMKVAAGGQVTWMADDSSSGIGSVDAFSGNSGSGIFNDSGQLVAVLDNGEEDYRDNGGCNVVNVIAEENGAEGFTPASRAMEDYCARSGMTTVACGCTEDCGEPQEGDECTNAQEIATRSQVLDGTVRGHTHRATGSCGGAGFDHFYRFNLEQAAAFGAEVDGFDTVLYLMDGCGGHELSCNDDKSAEDRGSFISQNLDPGTYILVVDSYDEAGDYRLALDFAFGGPDAGPTGSDAGLMFADGGVPDSGSLLADADMPVDGGGLIIIDRTDPMPGSSGCSCSAAPPRQRSQLGGLLFCLACLAWRRRR